MTETRLVHSVDDQLPDRRLPDSMLRNAGYNVEHWSDGEAFLNGADSARPACVLLNLHQPGLDALAVQARMPAARLDFPVIFMTGQEDLAVAIRAMNAGAADILESPFDSDKVLRSVAIAFDRLAERHLHRERAQSANLELAGLSRRERHVLDRLAGGYPNGAVAHEFGMGIPAVEACREDIVARLGLADFAAALRIAFAAGRGFVPGLPLAQDRTPPS